jgi:hypothetical protein
MGTIPYVSKDVYQQGDLVRLRFAHKYYQRLDIRTSDMLIVVNPVYKTSVSDSGPSEYECFSSRKNVFCYIMAKDLMKA